MAPASHGLDRFYSALPEKSSFAQMLRTLQLVEEPPELAATIAAAEQALADLLAEAPGVWCEPPDSAPPMVIVIMPTYNHARYLGKAIASVVEQRYAYWELWVCDDGSTDQTAQVVARANDARVHYEALPKQGASAARSHGLRQARGADRLSG